MSNAKAQLWAMSSSAQGFFDMLMGSDLSMEEIDEQVKAYAANLVASNPGTIDEAVQLIRTMEAFASARKQQEEIYRELRKDAEQKVETMKKMLKSFMEANKITKMIGESHVVSLQKNGGARPVSVYADQLNKVIDDLPPDFVKTVKVLNMEAIQAKAKADMEGIPDDHESNRFLEDTLGARHILYTIHPRGSHVRIK